MGLRVRFEGRFGLRVRFKNRFGSKVGTRFRSRAKAGVRIARSESTTRLCSDRCPEANQDRRGSGIENVKFEFGRMERLGDDLSLVLNGELGVVGDPPRDAIARIGVQTAHRECGEIPIEQRMGHVLELLAEDVEDGHVDPRGYRQMQHVQSQIRVFWRDLDARDDRCERVERGAGLQTRTAEVLGLGLDVHDDPGVALGDRDGDHGEFVARRHAGADGPHANVGSVQLGQLARPRGGHAEAEDDLAIDERAVGEPGDGDEVDRDEGGGDVEGEFGAERSGTEGEEGRFEREARRLVERERVGRLVGALGKERPRNRHVGDLATRTVRRFLFAREFFAP